MRMFFIYSIKVAICLAAFYLFYKLLLSRDTFHAFNRATLLLLMLLSLVLPFVNISVDEPTVAYDGMVQIEQLLAMGVVDDGPAALGADAHTGALRHIYNRCGLVPCRRDMLARKAA